ncbi:MAG: carboxypeptidase regulatory-like domain-containing protein [Gemmatimonadaceae bacterium]
MHRLGLVAALCLAFQASSVWAQDTSAALKPASLRGMVLDGAGRPLPAVRLSMVVSGLSTTTDTNGPFALAAVPPGRQAFLLRRVGFRPASHILNLPPGETTLVAFAMTASARELDTVVVSEALESEAPRLVDFERRRNSGGGGHVHYQGRDRATSSGGLGGHPPQGAIIEVRVYVMRAGIRTRLGAVNGMATERFELSPNLIKRELQLIAEPVGGWDRRSTDPLGGRRRVDTSDPTPAWRTGLHGLSRGSARPVRIVATGQQAPEQPHLHLVANRHTGPSRKPPRHPELNPHASARLLLGVLVG